MRPLAVLALTGVLTTLGLAAAPSPARAMAPESFAYTSTWWIGISTKVVVRILEFVDWLEEDLRAQLDRRRRRDPTPPVIAPPLEAVASGGTTTAPGDALGGRRTRGGMIP